MKKEGQRRAYINNSTQNEINKSNECFFIVGRRGEVSREMFCKDVDTLTTKSITAVFVRHPIDRFD